MFWIILILAICIIVYFMNSNGDNTKEYSLDDKEVDSSFVMCASDFIKGYISLKKAHSVSGWVSLLVENKDDGFIKIKSECSIQSVDERRGNECFETWLYVDESLAKTDYKKIGEYIKKEFADTELHYAYTEREYYSFEGSRAIISWNGTLMTYHGAKLIPTLTVLKKEIEKIDSELKINIGDGGMMIHNE